MTFNKIKANNQRNQDKGYEQLIRKEENGISYEKLKDAQLHS